MKGLTVWLCSALFVVFLVSPVVVSAQTDPRPAPPQPQMAPPPPPGGMACPMMPGRSGCGRLLRCLLPLLAVIHVMLAVWVYTDIRKRGEGHGIFIVLALLGGIPATILYALVRIGDRKTQPLGGAAVKTEAETVRLQTVGKTLAQLTQAGELFEKLPERKVRCYACGHRCLILDGHDGICRVRFNRGGTLFVPHGYFGGIQCDPIEKKPFFHARPGTLAMSFGMLGCDLHCGYCQNWLTSQTLRDPESQAPTTRMSAAEFCELAVARGAETVTSTYNEPLITSEWAVEVFREARRRGLKTSFVSNGNGTEEVLDYIRPWVDFYKVDLKSFRDKAYRELGGKLDNVLRTIQQLWQKGFWVEIVTLIVPGFNDSAEELGDIAKFLTGVSPDIPWHCTAFHPDYKMQDHDSTAARTLTQACELGREVGLRYCYAGNLPGQVGDWEDTRCPTCGETLVERSGFRVQGCWLTADGKCPKCATPIAGRWS